MKLASNALLSNHPSLELVIIPERAPRYDNLEWLNEYSNSELHRVKAELPAQIRDKIVIGRHKLDCDDRVRASRYGVIGTKVGGKKVDNLHLRGSSGKIATTRSMAGIMVQSGLATSAMVEEVAKNRRIQIKKKSPQGLGSHNRSSPRMEHEDARNQGANRQRSPPRMEDQYSVETSNRYSALVQENW